MASAAPVEQFDLNLWERIKARLAGKISSEAYQNWVMRTTLESAEGGVLQVAAPDQVTKEWMEQDYAEDIRASIRELNLAVTVSFVVRGAVATRGSGHMEPIFASAAGQVNPKLRFDNFVVGSCNQFAHAAAQAVASNPSRSYNPLFLYGGVGVGKTHLMHAIGQELLERHPSMHIVYTSSERFMNEMISCF